MHFGDKSYRAARRRAADAAEEKRLSRDSRRHILLDEGWGHARQPALICRARPTRCLCHYRRAAKVPYGTSVDRDARVKMTRRSFPDAAAIIFFLASL